MTCCWWANREKLESPEGAQPFAEEEIRQRLTEAEAVLAKGSGEAAYLLVWSACEAAIRNLIGTEGIAIARVTTAAYGPRYGGHAWHHIARGPRLSGPI